MRKEYLFESCRQLASAIVKNAADDYRRIRKRKKKYEEKNKKNIDDSLLTIDSEIKMIEKFFYESEWLDFLPSLDGEYILSRLKEEFE